MLESQKASFSLENFKVPAFTYNEGDEKNAEVKIGFSPQGTFNVKSEEYHLTLKISVKSADEDEMLFELTSVAIFKFNNVSKLTDIPPYFYKNAIAIVFPYIRAFISTLTLQANTRLLKLGLLNLSKLEKPLIENTVEI